MKTKFMFALFMLLNIISCDKEDDIQEEEKVTFISRCFTVLDSETGNPIEGVQVSVYGVASCGNYGCGGTNLGNGFTDKNGEICFRLDSNKNLGLLSCKKSGYLTYFTNPSPDLALIYMERIP